MIEEKKHATYSASGSERWINCPGSIQLCEKAPPGRSSRYADEGTRAHECLEAILKAFITGGKPYTVSRELEKTYPAEMVRHALESFKVIEAMARDKNRYAVIPNILCETRVPLPVSEPDQFGTVDAAIVDLFGRLTVIDFKYGAGILVNPEENSQLIYYALGLAHAYDYNFDDVEIVIIQPRAESEQGATRSWTLSISDLVAWRHKFENAIQVSKQPNPPLKTGKWCRFCPAASICPEMSTKALRDARIDFEPVRGSLSVPEAKGLTPDQISKILAAADRIETWLSKVREHACDLIERGERVPGFKLVQKRSIRKWSNIDVATKEASRRFGDLAFSAPELLSPAQLEKGVNKKDAAEFISSYASSVSSGTTLAPDEDSRPGVNPVALDFEPIGENDEWKRNAKDASTISTVTRSYSQVSATSVGKNLKSKKMAKNKTQQKGK